VQVAPPPQLPAPTAAQSRPLPAVSSGPAAIVVTNPQGQQVRRVDQLRSERREVVEGNRTVIHEGDRMIVRDVGGRAFIRHSDVDRFRYGARDVRVETRGRDNVTTVVLPNGQRVVTVLDSDGRLLRRSRWVDNREVIIIDQRPIGPGYRAFVELPPPVIRIPRERYIVEAAIAPPAMIYDTLMAPPVEQLDEPYSLDQIRYSYSLRERMPSVDIDTINFETGSWEVTPDQVERLAAVADAINRAISANPKEVFLIEGHTDAVGSDVDNLSLSDRRAETVALILSQQFNVPPENLVTQGYGEQFLKIPTDGPERRNRRVTARRITPLLAGGPGGPQPGGPR
jgi:outer membrane protein OmpA-like peptidoglycan-associated protein